MFKHIGSTEDYRVYIELESFRSGRIIAIGDGIPTISRYFGFWRTEFRAMELVFREIKETVATAQKRDSLAKYFKKQYSLGA